VTQKRKASVEMTKIHLLPSYTNQMFTVLHNNTTQGVQPNRIDWFHIRAW